MCRTPGHLDMASMGRILTAQGHATAVLTSGGVGLLLRPEPPCAVALRRVGGLALMVWEASRLQGGWTGSKLVLLRVTLEALVGPEPFYGRRILRPCGECVGVEAVFEVRERIGVVSLRSRLSGGRRR